MNYKLEKFWNLRKNVGYNENPYMNYKLEKFWNLKNSCSSKVFNSWTINLKSFEMIIKIYG